MLNRSESTRTQAEAGFIKSFSFIVILILASGSIISGYIDGIRRHNIPELIVVTLVLAVAGVTVGVCLRTIKQDAHQDNRRQQVIIIAVLFIIAMTGMVRDLIQIFR